MRRFPCLSLAAALCLMLLLAGCGSAKQAQAAESLSLPQTSAAVAQSPAERTAPPESTVAPEPPAKAPENDEPFSVRDCAVTLNPEGLRTFSAESGDASVLVTGEVDGPCLFLCDEGFSLSLILEENACLTAAFPSDLLGEISLTVNPGSRLILTEDSYVEVFSGTAETFSAIDSCGYHLYYNAEHEANAWLNARAYSLPGDGSLSPLI